MLRITLMLRHSASAVIRRVDAAIDRARARALASLTRAVDRRYEDAPLCSEPVGSRQDYLKRWKAAMEETHPSVDAFERACAAAVDPEWFHQLALVTQVSIKASPTCYQHGRLLYASLRRYIRDRPGETFTIVETGTARGFSALCLARALSDAGASGRVATFDVLPHEVPIYWNCIRDERGPCTRAELLGDYAALVERSIVFHRGDTREMLQRVVFPRVHFAFLDSVHTYEHVMNEFAAIRDRQQRGDVLFFDDVTPAFYPGVVKAAEEICRDHGYSPTAVDVSERRRYLVAEKQ